MICYFNSQYVDMDRIVVAFYDAEQNVYQFVLDTPQVQITLPETEGKVLIDMWIHDKGGMDLKMIAKHRRGGIL